MRHRDLIFDELQDFPRHLQNILRNSLFLLNLKLHGTQYCYSHEKSLSSNASLMVGKRVLQGEALSDLSDSYGTHDLGEKLSDHFGDKFGDLGDK
ncbi:hypothetical protein AVEN_22954-1 [Araneus ventricosus]|uniref:Uncharacterized protein n=1 Tax=Araneus ventricosus TaxID=182803 RepID=A0A4Y2RG59_ARAVE|nr:hypothetical protein AVEN_22954-1 [Araneus ventricosus]